MPQRPLTNEEVVKELERWQRIYPPWGIFDLRQFGVTEEQCLEIYKQQLTATRARETLTNMEKTNVS